MFAIARLRYSFISKGSFHIRPYFCKIIIYIIVFLFCSAPLDAQDAVSKTDSLENILRTNPPEGVDILHIYSELSSHYSRSFNPEKNREYALKGIHLARQLGNRYEVSFLYNNMGMAYDDLSKYDSAMVQYKEALSLIEEMEIKKQESVWNISFLKGITYANIGNLYNVQGLSDLALEHYQKAITMFEETDVKDRLAKVFRNLALVYTDMKNYGQAEYYLTKNMEICTLLQDSLGMASTLTVTSITRCRCTLDRLTRKLRQTNCSPTRSRPPRFSITQFPTVVLGTGSSLGAFSSADFVLSLPVSITSSMS